MASTAPSLFEVLEQTAPGALESASVPEMPAALLAEVGDVRAEIRRQEARLMQCAAAWADLHPVESIDHAATVPGSEGEVAIAGEGAPLVAEFCVAEFAAAMGMSTDAGRHYLGAAVETRHRLPRLWKRATNAEVDAWRVRRIADATLPLPKAGAEWVDRQVAPLADSVGPARLQRIIDEAIRTYDPETYAEQLAADLEARYLKIQVDHAPGGAVATMSISGSLDLLDGYDLKNAVEQRAAERLAAGDTSPLAVRRTKALADLARLYAGLPLDLPGPESVVEPGERQRAGVETAPTSRPGSGRHVELVVHLDATGSRPFPFGPFAWIDTPGLRDIHVTTEQLTDWLRRPGTTITVRPVLDLAEHLESAGYAPSDRLKRQTQLVNRTCVFPHCHRSADTCDCDHVEEHATGGRTCSCNLAPLCRRHHRLKTHTAWTYDVLDTDTYLWRSPHGLQFWRDRGGTIQITGPPAAGA